MECLVARLHSTDLRKDRKRSRISDIRLGRVAGLEHCRGERSWPRTPSLRQHDLDQVRRVPALRKCTSSISASSGGTPGEPLLCRPSGAPVKRQDEPSSLLPGARQKVVDFGKGVEPIDFQMVRRFAVDVLQLGSGGVSRSPDEPQEFNSLTVELLRAALGQIRTALPIVFHRPFQHSKYAAHYWDIEPDESVGTFDTFRIGV